MRSSNLREAAPKRRARGVGTYATSSFLYNLILCLNYRYMRRARAGTREHKKRVAAADAIDRRPVMDAPLVPLRVEDAYFIAARTSLATSSMSSAFSAGKGRFMSSSSSTVLPPTVTTKAPLRGFSLLTSTVTPGKALASRFARVLNAPQLLQASTDTTEPEEPALGFLALAADGFLAGAFDFVFLAMALVWQRPALPKRGERGASGL